MKKSISTLTIILAAVVVLLAGCNKEESKIVGSWSINMETSIYQYIAVHGDKQIDAITGATYEDEDGNTIEERTMADLKVTACEIEFKENGTCTGYYTQDGVKKDGTVNYKLVDQTLTLDGVDWTVIKLNDQELVIERTCLAASEKGANKEFRHIAFIRK